MGPAAVHDDELHDVKTTFNRVSEFLDEVVRSYSPLKRTANWNLPCLFTRRYCKVSTRICYTPINTYISRVEGGIPQNIKSFWFHEKNLKSLSTFPSTVMLESAIKATEADEKCKLFAEYISTVFDVDVAMPLSSTLVQTITPTAAFFQRLMSKGNLRL